MSSIQRTDRKLVNKLALAAVAGLFAGGALVAGCGANATNQTDKTKEAVEGAGNSCSGANGCSAANGSSAADKKEEAAPAEGEKNSCGKNSCG